MRSRRSRPARSSPSPARCFIANHGAFQQQIVSGQLQVVGKDVILTRNLLVHSVHDLKGYLLLTAAAAEGPGADPAALGMRAVSGTYEHFGAVQAFLYDLDAAWRPAGLRTWVTTVFEPVPGGTRLRRPVGPAPDTPWWRRLVLQAMAARIEWKYRADLENSQRVLAQSSQEIMPSRRNSLPKSSRCSVKRKGDGVAVIESASMKRWRTGMAVFLAALLALLAACTPPAAPGGPPKVATTGSIELVWATPGNPQEVAVYQKIADNFMQANPNIKVKLDRDASDFQKVTTLIAGGSPPDIIFFTINNWPAVAGKDVLEPLDDYIKRDNYDLADFYDQIVKPYRHDGKNFGQGKLYGLPKEIAVRATYYNVDAWKEAGLPQPAADKPLSWNEFLAAAQKLTKRSGDRVDQYGIVLETWWGIWAIFAWSNGGEVVDNPWNPTRSTMDDPRVVEAFKFWTDLVVTHKVAPTMATMKELGKAPMFSSARAATYYNGRWMVPLFREQAKFNWDVMPMPMAKQRAQLLTGSMFGVSAKSKNKEAAWKLLSYIVGKEGQTEMTKLGLLLPSRKSVAESDTFLKSTPPTSNKVFLDELQYARVLPMHPKYPQMEKAVNDEMELVLTGQKKAEDAIKDAHKKVSEILGAG